MQWLRLLIVKNYIRYNKRLETRMPCVKESASAHIAQFLVIFSADTLSILTLNLTTKKLERLALSKVS